MLEAAKAANINVGAHIAYSANSSDVSAQVLQLKSLNPDVVIFISYSADTILYFKTMKNLDYLPPIIIGDDAGFSDPSFIPNVGDLAQGALNRSAFDIGKEGSNSYIVDQMFKAKYGRDLDDTSARWMQALFVTADAINRAGSTDPEKIQTALKATDLEADQLMIGYRRREIRRHRTKHAGLDFPDPARRASNTFRWSGPTSRHRQARLADYEEGGGERREGWKKPRPTQPNSAHGINPDRRLLHSIVQRECPHHNEGREGGGGGGGADGGGGRKASKVW